MSKELVLVLDLEDTVEELTQEQIIELELNEICVDSDEELSTLNLGPLYYLDRDLDADAELFAAMDLSDKVNKFNRILENQL